MALPTAIGCGVIAGIAVPLLAKAGDPTGGWLVGQTVRLPIGTGFAFGFSGVAFVLVTLMIWVLLASVRGR